MARALSTPQRFFGASLVAMAAAGGCYYDSFDKVSAVDEGTGGMGQGGENTGGFGNDGGATSSGGGNTAPMVALAVKDNFATRQGDDLREDVTANDGGPGLTVTGFDDSDPDRPSSLDAVNFSISEAGLLRFDPHPDFWGTYRATYTIEDENGEESTGEISIAVEPEAISLATIEAGWGGIVIDGDTGDELGFSMAGIRDFNGDGREDFLLGAPGASGDNGRVAVIFGGEQLADLDLSEMNDNVQFYEGDGITTRAGVSVSSAGNINGDLFNDIIVGAAGVGQDGRAYVVYGLGNPAGIPKALKEMPTMAEGFTLRGESGERAGRGVAGGGDLDGDGSDDVIVFSNAGANPGSYVGVTTSGNNTLAAAAQLSFNSGLIYDPTTAARAAFVDDMFGNDSRAEVLFPARQDGTTARVVLLRGKTGEAPNEWPADADFMDTQGIGWRSNSFASPTTSPTVAGAGDFDGDTFPDVVYCISGGDCRIVLHRAATDFDLTTGRTITGFAGAQLVVSGGGDVNDDDLDDLVFADESFAYVLWGAESPPTANLDMSDLDEEGFSIDPEGETVGEVAILGDVNDDNIDDIAVALPDYDGGKGRVYVIFGAISE